MFQNFFIINRSGGVVYTKSFSISGPSLSTNDSLRLGSTFHSLHAIATQIAPIASDGIVKLETDTFILRCLQTLTGVKFVITISAPPTSSSNFLTHGTSGTSSSNSLLNSIDLEGFLQNVYELYSDYVLKNPFYEVDMPIRCELFNKSLDKLVAKFASTQSKRRSL